MVYARARSLACVCVLLISFYPFLVVSAVAFLFSANQVQRMRLAFVSHCSNHNALTLTAQYPRYRFFSLVRGRKHFDNAIFRNFALCELMRLIFHDYSFTILSSFAQNIMYESWQSSLTRKIGKNCSSFNVQPIGKVSFLLTKIDIARAVQEHWKKNEHHFLWALREKERKRKRERKAAV